MKRQEKCINIFSAICMCLTAASILNLVVHLWKYGAITWDYYWVWRECACAIRGIDVGEAIRTGMFIEGVGQMPPTFATFPWSRIIGNIIHPGFIPFEWAVVYSRILYCIVAIWMGKCIMENLSQNNIFEDKKRNILAVLIILMSFYWTDAVISMNNGSIVCFLAIIAVLTCEKNEYLAGVCMALAMMKPQIALLFYITLLVKKKYKTIITSAILLISSWVVYLVYIGGNPIQQIVEVLNQHDEKQAEFIWFGFMDFLTRFGIGGTKAMIFSMLIGIAGTILLTIIVLKSEYADNSLVLYSVPALFSTAWCYKSDTDLLILILPSMLVFIIFKKFGMNMKTVIVSLIYLELLNVKTFTGGVRRIVGYDWLTGRSLDAWIRMVIFLVLIVCLCYGKVTSLSLEDENV